MNNSCNLTAAIEMAFAILDQSDGVASFSVPLALAGCGDPGVGRLIALNIISLGEMFPSSTGTL